MKKMNIKKSLSAVWMLTVLVGCVDYLDEVQDNRIGLDSSSEVQQLLTNAYPNAFFAEFAETMSDNADDRGSGAASDQMAARKAYRWEDFNSEVSNESPANYWLESYGAIAHANQALAIVEQQKGDPAGWAGVKGEALLAKAYAHFMLVNFWALRYDPATAANALGVPYVREVETVAVKSYSRNTVQEVYDFIEKDITEGIPLINNSDYEKPKFHFNKEAAHAFATRFYLYKANWGKVIEHAGNVLGASPAVVLRDWEARRSQTYSEQVRGYSSSAERANLLIVWANSSYSRNTGRNRYGLSASKRDLLFSKGNGNPFGRFWSYGTFSARGDLGSKCGQVRGALCAY